jgi:5'-nucleotidase
LRILVTNDDGFLARGLWVLAKALSEVGEVVIVAPDREQSAVGSSVTLHHPLRAKEIRSPLEEVKSYLVEGTPADCVILALGHLLDEGIDIIFSGINEGSNLGDDVLLSGTVGAALQGYLKGIPSVALSVGALTDVHVDAAARLAVVLAPLIAGLPAEAFLNINLPNLPLDQIKGIEVTRLGRRAYSDEIVPGHDGKREYYWVVRGKAEWQPDEGTDIWAFTNDRISITPLNNDLTSQKALSDIQDLPQTLLDGLYNQGG